MQEPVRIGILGAGGIAERAMVEPAREVSGVEVVAIGARDPLRAAAFADRVGLVKSGSYEDIFADDNIDLVYLALPPFAHAQWAVRAMQAGKHVLCEKPLSANATTAQLIADAAERYGRRAFVGFHYRMHHFTHRLLEVIRSGDLGAVQDVQIDFSIPHFVVQPGNSRLDGDLAGGAVMDVGCYAVDLLRAAWGEPEVIAASAQLYDGDKRIDVQTDAALTVLGDVPVRVRSSFIGDDKGRMSLRIQGAAATLEATNVIVPQWGAVLRVESGGELLIEERAVPEENSYVRQLEHIAAVLSDGLPSPLDAAHAVGTMRVVDAIYLAAGLQPRCS
jgi:predicted dehydrogenase